MGAECKDGFHLTALKLIHERRTNDRQDDGKEEREPQRGRFRHTYDSVLHKPSWQKAIGSAKARTGES
jgi:hypothetical protein